MFAYTDPTASNFLQSQNALDGYRKQIDSLYTQYALNSKSAFTSLDAFKELTREKGLRISEISWIAFPKLVNQPFNLIDKDRFKYQDEYVEWHTTTKDNKVTRITFTTEFPEYYQSLATIGVDGLIAAIQNTIQGANPTIEELFGREFNPKTASPQERSNKFRKNIQSNPWNNGQKGILCLTQNTNTAEALFGLMGFCAELKSNLPPSEVCGNVGGACVPGRNSDPAVCQAAQNLVRNAHCLSLQDPFGIKILKLEGIWKIGGKEIDINNPKENLGVWSISRNGRRAVLDVSKGVTIENTTITSGAQVATKLRVSAAVISAPKAVLPVQYTQAKNLGIN